MEKKRELLNYSCHTDKRQSLNFTMIFIRILKISGSRNCLGFTSKIINIIWELMLPIFYHRAFRCRHAVVLCLSKESIPM